MADYFDRLPELAAVLGAERFVQEISSTASLPRPDVLPLFDSRQADGFLYYVLPFIDGETLRETLDRDTQRCVDEAVGITTDRVGGAYAYRTNNIQRDIKPEYILLHDSRPMVAEPPENHSSHAGWPHYDARFVRVVPNRVDQMMRAVNRAPA